METAKLSRVPSPLVAEFALVVPILAIALCISSPVSAQGNGPQNPPGQPNGPQVTVVNTGANPVPVSGAVTVSGTSSVTLSNNTATTPVFVQSVGQPAQTPFQTSLTFGTALTVASDKQLTIEFVTANCSLDNTLLTSTEIDLTTTVGGNTVGHNFSPKFSRNFNSGTGINRTFFTSTDLTRLYADPGTTVSFSIIQGFNCNVTLSGYAVTK